MKKETLFDCKVKVFQSPKNCTFPKGLTYAFVPKRNFFFIFFFGQKRTRKKVYDVLDRKKTFYYYKNNNFLTTQKWHFSKGINPFFWSINAIFVIICFRSK